MIVTGLILTAWGQHGTDLNNLAYKTRCDSTVADAALRVGDESRRSFARWMVFLNNLNDGYHKDTLADEDLMKHVASGTTQYIVEDDSATVPANDNWVPLSDRFSFLLGLVSAFLLTWRGASITSLSV